MTKNISVTVSVPKDIMARFKKVEMITLSLFKPSLIVMDAVKSFIEEWFVGGGLLDWEKINSASDCSFKKKPGTLIKVFGEPPNEDLHINIPASDHKHLKLIAEYNRETLRDTVLIALKQYLDKNLDKEEKTFSRTWTF